MNPHFVFNSLNSIQYYILDHEIEAALDFIADFSTLMRISLHNSSRELINLEDEVLFLNLYLKVECRRFPEKLNYSITMNEDLIQEDINIPPMLIQPYVENAILHGIANKKGNGNIQVNFTQDTEHHTITCKIRDDGVGREAAQKVNSSGNHRSYAMKITASRLKLLNYQEEDAYKVKIIDLKNEKGNETGTEVQVTFPDDL